MTDYLRQLTWRTWEPALGRSLRESTRATLVADIVAGLTVGLVALPLAIAFAIASGVTPQAGIYTAIVGGAIVAILGGSRVQVSGPTGAFIVIVAGIVAAHGLSGLLMVTMMAGVILIVLALTGLGQAVKFIPRPVVIGFTNGIALLIASTQIKDFLGLQLPEVPGEFFARMEAYGSHLTTLTPAAVGLAGVSLGLILLTPRWFPRVPGSAVALAAGTAVTALFGLPVETIGSMFGGIPRALPSVDIPAFRADLILPLLPSALTVALLAAVESLLSAVVADGMTGDRHNSNAELFGQGMANVLVPMVGGIPVTGAIARTATNIRSGARTPIAALVHAATLLVIVLVAAPLAAHIPLATLAAVLFVVAWNMGEWREIGGILKLDLADKAVWAITFGLTVMADLTLAVEVGMALAALLYIYRVSDTTSIELVTPEYIEHGRVHVLQDKEVPAYVDILRIHGPFLFGTTDKLEDATADLTHFKPILVLRLRNMTAIDASGLHALERLSDRVRASGRTLLLCGARHQPARFLDRAEFLQHVGAENILPHVQAAIARARELHNGTGASPGLRHRPGRRSRPGADAGIPSPEAPYPPTPEPRAVAGRTRDVLQ
jgi:SulP family sulfate permease